jgi:hypothetical protein
MLGIVEPFMPLLDVFVVLVIVHSVNDFSSLGVL